jgi:CRP-like cAMP-binding protein
MASVASALVQKLNRFFPLNQDELASLAGLEARRRRIPAHTEIVHERQEGHHAFILQEGWACAYKLLPDGGRQVIDFSIPGDFMGLRSVLLRTSDHAFAAVSDIVVAEVSARQMIDTFQRMPRLGAAILWAASRDEAMVVEHLVSIGRRSALVRHIASPGRAGAAPAARGARLGKRLRLRTTARQPAVGRPLIWWRRASDRSTACSPWASARPVLWPSAIGLSSLGKKRREVVYGFRTYAPTRTVPEP